MYNRFVSGEYRDRDHVTGGERYYCYVTGEYTL